MWSVLSAEATTTLQEWKKSKRSLIYEGLKHYFIVNFPQRPGALKEFVNEVLGENDDITYFQFTKKNNRERKVRQWWV